MPKPVTKSDEVAILDENFQKQPFIESQACVGRYNPRPTVIEKKITSNITLGSKIDL
jgi:hypothetical protein